MSVQFILGRSGTGKTHSCVHAITEQLCQGEQGPALVLLVPEQATYQAERMVLLDPHIAGFSRLRILSFDRLQFLLAGIRPGRTELSRIGQELLVHKVLRSCKDRLTFFRDVSGAPGLAIEFSRVITELHQDDKQPEDIDRLLGTLAGGGDATQAAAKFQDLKVVFDAYVQYLQGPGHTLLNLNGQLTQVRTAIREADWLKGALVWVDGFAGFTYQEMGVLIELIQVSSMSHVALCLDPEQIDLQVRDESKLNTDNLFYAAERTYVQLCRAFDRIGISITRPLLLHQTHRFAQAPDLAHLEKALFSTTLNSELRTPNSGSGSQIQITTAPNRRAEIEWVAGQVMDLVRHGSIRFRDIAVIVSDLACYQPLIEAAFGDRGIPYFIDRPQSFDRHPVIELIQTALKVAVGGIETPDVLAFLKTGLGPLTLDKVYQLETYCLAYGIDKDPWLQAEPWAHADPAEFDLATIDRLRREAVKDMVTLCEGLGLDRMMTAAGLIAEIWALVERLDVHSRLATWCKDDPADRQGHRQLMDKLVHFLDEFVEIFDKEHMPLEDLCSILGQALARLTFKLIPPTLDQVLVGAIERSRHPEIKAAFLIGATQRQFPMPVTFDKVLSDEDRALAREHGFEMAATLEQDLASRPYLAYIAMTRPSHRLVLTYPRVDERGAAVTASPLVDQVRSLFADLAIGRTEARSIERAGSVADLTDGLSLMLSRDNVTDEPTWNESASILAALCLHPDPRLRQAGCRVLESLQYANQVDLSETVAGAAFGESMVCSVSRLTSLAACPFQHFAKYVLELRPRRTFGLEPVDLGTFYHAVLDQVLRTLASQGQDLKAIDDAALLALTDGLIDRQIRSDLRLAAFVRGGQHQAFIMESAREVLKDCVLDLAAMSRAGAFEPAGSEVGFGPDTQIGPVEMTLPGGRRILVQGRIDRVDVTGGAQGHHAIVIDYKRTTGGRFSWGEFFHGLDLQLPTYLLALHGRTIESKTIRAAVGAFIVPIEVPAKDVDVSELASRERRFLRKAKGLFHAGYAAALDAGCQSGRSRYFDLAIKKDGEPYGSSVVGPESFDRVLDHAHSTLVALADSMVSGRIEVRPYRMGTDSPCSHCDYGPVCRFDWQINEYRALEALGKGQVLERLEKDHG